MSDTQPNRPVFDHLPAGGYVRQAHLIPAVVPFSSATLWRKVKAGTFPAPVKLSERVTAWRVEDVREWLNSPKVGGGDSAVTNTNSTRLTEAKPSAQRHAAACGRAPRIPERSGMTGGRK